MTRSESLANAPAEAPALTVVDSQKLERLTLALEAVAAQLLEDPELRLYNSEEAAVLLGKTKNWVEEAIREGRIPYTRVGQSPRMTAAHIRWVHANGEHWPNQYAAPIKAVA